MKKYLALTFLLFCWLLPLAFVSAEMPPPPPNDDNTLNNGNNNTNFTQVTLIRAQNGYKVYEIKNGKRHWIPTAEIFNKYHFSWQDIQVVPESQLKQYPRVKLLRAEGDKKVYYLTESGMIRHIPNEKIFNSYGDKWEDVVTVSPEEIRTYKPNNLIRLNNGYKVYLLENGKKRWIKTAQVFNRLGYDWSKIAPVNQVELNSYPQGSDIE